MVCQKRNRPACAVIAQMHGIATELLLDAFVRDGRCGPGASGSRCILETVRVMGLEIGSDPRIDSPRLDADNLGSVLNRSALRHQQDGLDAPVGSDIPYLMKGTAEPTPIMWIETTFDGILRSSHELRYERRTIPVRICGYLLSRAAMHARVSSIAACIDGGTHILRTADGQEYRNVRMDSFSLINERTGGPGIVAEYEIVYTQLRA